MFLLHSLFIWKKNLSIQSSKDEIYVLDTIDHYWIYLGKQFFPKSSYLSAIYDSFKSKVLKVVISKNRHHLY